VALSQVLSRHPLHVSPVAWRLRRRLRLHRPPVTRQQRFPARHQCLSRREPLLREAGFIDRDERPGSRPEAVGQAPPPTDAPP